jgi:hypothetical protein
MCSFSYTAFKETWIQTTFLRFDLKPILGQLNPKRSSHPVPVFPSFLHLGHNLFGAGGTRGCLRGAEHNPSEAVLHRENFEEKCLFKHLSIRTLYLRLSYVYSNAKLSSKIWNTDTDEPIVSRLHKAAPRTHCDCSFREIQPHLSDFLFSGSQPERYTNILTMSMNRNENVCFYIPLFFSISTSQTLGPVVSQGNMRMEKITQ